MSNFILDPRLAADSEWLADLGLCQLLLSKDALYPWLILVPKVADCKEIIDLSMTQQQQLWQESAAVSRILQLLFKPDKINVAALGNVVSQLHVHHIARFHRDASWPKPVWGQHPPAQYEPQELQERKAQIIQLLSL